MIRHAQVHIAAKRQIAFERRLLGAAFEHLPNHFVIGGLPVEPILQPVALRVDVSLSEQPGKIRIQDRRARHPVPPRGQFSFRPFGALQQLSGIAQQPRGRIDGEQTIDKLGGAARRLQAVLNA